MSRVDVVVFGATGFTGRHAVERLAQLGERRPLRWAVAARNPDKLRELMEKVSANTGEDLSAVKIIIADVQNEESLRSMCEQTKVLVNCCGPYTLYGEPVVRAAIRSNTHYVDCSGEPNFIELMQLKYDKEAREAGVYVVSACGFESIPVDLGLLYLRQNFDGILHSVESYMTADNQNANINTGTWESFVYCLPHLLHLSTIRKKNYPTALPTFNPKLKYKLVHKRFNGWCLPFPGNDSSAVYRTQRFLYETEHQRPTHIKTYYRVQSLFNALAIAFSVVVCYIMSYFKATRELLLKHSSTFSNGMITKEPSEEAIKNMSYEFNLYGVGWERSEEAYIDAMPPRKVVIAKISGKNPGYGMTVMGLLYSAIAILEEPEKMPAGGGVLSPGAAFGKTSLVKHLQENGVKFEIIRKHKSE